MPDRCHFKMAASVLELFDWSMDWNLNNPVFTEPSACLTNRQTDKRTLTVQWWRNIWCHDHLNKTTPPQKKQNKTAPTAEEEDECRAGWKHQRITDCITAWFTRRKASASSKSKTCTGISVKMLWTSPPCDGADGQPRSESQNNQNLTSRSAWFVLEAKGERECLITLVKVWGADHRLTLTGPLTVGC